MPWPTRQPTPGESILDSGDSINQGLRRWWMFNENGGTLLHDYSGFGNNRTLTNINPATQWIIVPDNPAGSGYALNYDGVNDHEDMGPETYLHGVTGFSLTVWAKLSDDSLSSRWLYNKNDGSEDFQAFFDGNDLRSRLDAGGSNTVINGPDKASFDYESWWFYVTTYNGANHSVYFNGKLHASPALTGTTDFTGGSSNLFVSGTFVLTSLQAWPGPITNVRMYTRPLTSNEIMELYLNPYAGILRPRRTYFVPAVAGGLSIPVAINSYRQHRQSGV